ncbi:hypothetical protein J1TS1_28460 [Shouchella clausii]|uniref:hypothetical protein n=1 Tax=Shouchella clausii TaxID=79880 RepID=UPI001B040309|nr:hypothetical protein [Shouchella clausii]GIN08701.1 hypothetical protein J1TS1_28460 [Shouchella clausii]
MLKQTLLQTKDGESSIEISNFNGGVDITLTQYQVNETASTKGNTVYEPASQLTVMLEEDEAQTIANALTSFLT